MLSIRMSQALLQADFTSKLGMFRDGRTIAALRSRGYITKVEWRNANNTYTFKLTSAGTAMMRNLRFNNEVQLKEMLS